MKRHVYLPFAIEGWVQAGSWRRASFDRLRMSGGGWQGWIADVVLAVVLALMALGLADVIEAVWGIGR